MAFFIFHLNLCGTLATRIRGILIKNGDIINITVRWAELSLFVQNKGPSYSYTLNLCYSASRNSKYHNAPRYFEFWIFFFFP